MLTSPSHTLTPLFTPSAAHRAFNDYVAGSMSSRPNWDRLGWDRLVGFELPGGDPWDTLRTLEGPKVLNVNYEEMEGLAAQSSVNLGGVAGNASPIVYMDDMPGDRRAQIVKEAYSKNGCSKTGTKVQAGIDTHSDGPSLVAKKFHRDLNIESTILCSPTVYVTRSNGMSAGGHKRNPSGRLAGLAVHAVNQDVDAELRSKFSRSS